MTELQISKKSCLSCRVMKTDEKMSNETSRLTELLHMIISMIILHWDTPYTWARFPQLQDWLFEFMVSHVIKIWEITWQITSKMHFCVVSFLQEVQIYKKTYVFHMQSEKLMKKLICATHMMMSIFVQLSCVFSSDKWYIQNTNHQFLYLSHIKYTWRYDFVLL